MNFIYDAHALTIFIVIISIMVTPIYSFATYVFSGASVMKGLVISAAFWLWGGVMFWVCLAQILERMGLLGNAIVPLAWILPSLLLYLNRDWFLSDRLSQKWLVGLQIFRVIGGVLLIEMMRGHIPGIFAYPAGLGDILAGLLALYFIVVYRNHTGLPKVAIFIVLIVGVSDFVSAFFFVFTSSETPGQLFFPETKSLLINFPTGMIPLFLVPYAIFFHTLSWLNYLRYESR